ncbi:MAG TPA: phospholipase D family protein [Pirellulaceae bacterium]|nr:phospholipase D family protein [Pirellulaceae bacterium]
MRRHHVFGAGFLATALGVYPVAARLGLVPSGISSAVQWITNSGAPLLPGLPPGGTGPAAFGPAVPSQPPYAAQAGGYQTSAYPTAAYPGQNYGAGDIACYFSPAGGCTDAVVAEIRQARQQILVQAYSFTSVPIANALVEAHNRGVAVYIVLDKSQRSEQYSGLDFVARAGIPTLIDAAHAIAHNKIILIDRLTIITGSFNFTTNAEKSNAENLLVIRNRPDLYQAYENNFRHHYEHSQTYDGRAANSPQPTRTYMPAQDGRVLSYPAASGAQPWGVQTSQAPTPAAYPSAGFR